MVAKGMQMIACSWMYMYLGRHYNLGVRRYPGDLWYPWHTHTHIHTHTHPGPQGGHPTRRHQ